MPCIATPLKPRDPRRTSNRGHPLLHAWRAGMDEPIFGEINVRPAYAALRSEPTDCSRGENVHAKQMNETEANRLRTFLQTPGAPGPAAARRRDVKSAVPLLIPIGRRDHRRSRTRLLVIVEL